jgi:H+/gluconate symporter-like permease
MTGFTEAETFKTWTLSVSVISLVGLMEVLLASGLAPHPFG